MEEVLVLKEFSKILRKYMKTFSLETIDIAYLANSNKRTISSVLDNLGSLQLETAEAIAKSFGLRYYEFGNPNHPIPSFNSLPEKTKQRTTYRKKEGPAKEITYTSSDINSCISEVLSTYKVDDEFLAEEIANSIREKYRLTYSVSEIINRFNNSFKNSIVKTNRKDVRREGRGPKPVYYRLVKGINITVV